MGEDLKGPCLDPSTAPPSCPHVNVAMSGMERKEGGVQITWELHNLTSSPQTEFQLLLSDGTKETLTIPDGLSDSGLVVTHHSLDADDVLLDLCAYDVLCGDSDLDESSNFFPETMVLTTGAKVQYECGPAKLFDGTETTFTTTCGWDGTWSDVMPECQGSIKKMFRPVRWHSLAN